MNDSVLTTKEFLHNESMQSIYLIIILKETNPQCNNLSAGHKPEGSGVVQQAPVS